ncbi:MAG: hypothetical protein IIV45_19305, partial [Lachnospiraceae bacterium]|nr:hypothetical protein [Lachnospiraceae bacterium]
MKIAICTNNKETLTSLYQILWDEIDCQIDTYSNSGKLWSAYQQGLHYQIVFCESQASPISGLELGKKIRTIDANVFLIYFLVQRLAEEMHLTPKVILFAPSDKLFNLFCPL